MGEWKMAQRTIHMLLAVLVAEKIEITDKNRFFLGSILPDGYIEPTDRKKAHFIKYIAEENCMFFDFAGFDEKYHNEIVSDDLYLGYYAHLVEDAFYRYFLYYEKDLMAKLKSYELDILHQDYHILNSYFAKHYKMPKELEIPEGFEAERLNEIVAFDAQKLVSDYLNDLHEAPGQKTCILTEEVVEEFISKYTEPLMNELNSIKAGSSRLEALQYKWERKK